jgi:lysophospholipase L1-like esterase
VSGGHLWVLGDSWSDPKSYNVPAYGWNWSAVLAERLGLGVVNSAGYGAAYTYPGGGGPSFPAQAATGWGVGAAAAIVFGGVNDVTGDAERTHVRDAAALTFGLIRRLCPDAPLFVVGPQWPAHERTPAVARTRGALREAAAAVSAPLIDPSPWLLDRPDLLVDFWHPNAAGSAIIADRLEHDVGLALTLRDHDRTRTR